MVRSPLFVRALGAAIGVPLLAGLALGAAPAHAAPPATGAVQPGVQAGLRAEDPEPLAITIDTMSPSVVPRTGPITLTGTVTNLDTETWSTINLYAFMSASPMTTEAELREAVEVPVADDVGARLRTELGALETVDELAPGDSYDFTVEVPRDYYELAGGGVYWFGIHALAEGPQPRDLVADGRARTFLPYVPANAQGQLETALVIPLRRHVAYEADGSVAHLDHWERTLSDGGRMRALVDFGAAADGSPVTWLMDPSLPDVVRRLAAGNPPRSLEPTLPPDAEEPTGEGSDEPSPSEPAPTSPEATEEPADDLDPQQAAVAELATEWLADLRSALSGDQVLALPYGDLDVAAAADYDNAVFDLAVARTGAVLAAWDVAATPAFGSPSGYLDAGGIALGTPATTTLLTDRMFGDEPPAVADTGNQRLVVLSSGAASGGPRPGDRYAGVSFRQRLVSEAAVRMLATGDRPLVTMLPLDWQPDDLDEFFSGLELDWLDLSTVSDATDRPAASVDPGRLTYPARQAERELRAANFELTEELIDAGRRLESILTRNDQVSSTVIDQALAGTSYAVREGPRRARVSARRSLGWLTSRLESVEVDAPPGVTLSGGTGQFAATVTNKLDQPVTVVVTSASDSGIRVSESEPLRLAAGSRTTVLLDVQTRRSGVHNVTLYLTNVNGDRIGSKDVVPIRSAQLSTVIWVIMASGAGILFLAVGARLVRRFRSRHDPEPVS